MPGPGVLLVWGGEGEGDGRGGGDGEGEGRKRGKTLENMEKPWKTVGGRVGAGGRQGGVFF